jgi:hypothetical protein
LDIFPRSTDAQTMNSRREILISAALLAGATLAEPAVAAAAPYTRLDSERGGLDEELTRIDHELAVIAENEPLNSASQTATAVYATWANLTQLDHSNDRRVAALKARAAIYAGGNAITTMDRDRGLKWFEQAHRHARLAEDDDLIALAHYQETVGALWWKLPEKDILTSAQLADVHGTSAAAQGRAHVLQARIASRRFEGGRAVHHAEKAVRLASSNSQSPRADTWTKAQAHAFAARSLAPFPQLLAAVQEHTYEALRTLPAHAHGMRCHARLNLAEAQAKNGQLDAAVETVRKAMEPMPDGHGNKTLGDRLATFCGEVDRRYPGNHVFAPVRELLSV